VARDDTASRPNLSQSVGHVKDESLQRRAAQSNIISMVVAVAPYLIAGASGIASWLIKLPWAEAALAVYVPTSLGIMGGMWFREKERQRGETLRRDHEHEQRQIAEQRRKEVERDEQLRLIAAERGERERLAALHLQQHHCLDILMPAVVVQDRDVGTIQVRLRFFNGLPRAVSYVGYVPLITEVSNHQLTITNAKDVRPMQVGAREFGEIVVELPMHARPIREIFDGLPKGWENIPPNMAYAVQFRLSGSLKFRDGGDEVIVDIDKLAPNAMLQLFYRRSPGELGF
jgi:hypothetical protein